MIPAQVPVATVGRGRTAYSEHMYLQTFIGEGYSFEDAFSEFSPKNHIFVDVKYKLVVYIS